MDHEQIKRKVISGFAWESATKLITQIVSWGSTIVVARILLPSDYGLIAVASVFVELFVVLTRDGLAAGLINAKEINDDQLDTIFWISLALGLFIYTIIYAVAPFISTFYNMAELTSIIRFMGLVLIFSSLKIVPVSIALRNMEFKYRSIVEMIANLAMSITVVSLAMAGYGLWSLVWAMITRHLIETLAYISFLKHIPRFLLRISEVKDILIFGLKRMASNFLEFLNIRSGVFVSGFFLGEVVVGYYSMGIELASIPMSKFGTIFNSIAFPTFSRIKHDLKNSQTMFLNMHRYLLTISYPILLGITLIANDIVILLLTEKWEPIVPVLQVLCLVNLLRVSGMLLPYVLEGLGKVDCVLKYHTTTVIVMPAAFIIGAQWGLKGVLIAWMIAYPPLYLFLLYYALKALKLSLGKVIFSLKPVFVASTIMILSIFVLKYFIYDSNIYFRLASTISVGILAYSGTYYYLYRDELVQIKKGLALFRAQ